MDGRRYLVWFNWLFFIIIWRQFLVYLLWFSLTCFVRRELSYLLAPILWIPFQSAPLTFKVSLHSDSINARASTSTPKYHRLFSKTKLALNWKVTEWVPKLASNWVLMLTVGGLPVAFCTTRKSLVTISMTCPVWKTKSPFLFTASEERQPGIFAWDLNSRVGDPCKVCEAQDGEKRNKKEAETDRSHVEHSDVVEVWTQWQLEDLRSGNPWFIIGMRVCPFFLVLWFVCLWWWVRWLGLRYFRMHL